MDTINRESSAISYATSIKSKITTALDIQNGLNAVEYYRKLGLISFPPKPKADRRAGRTSPRIKPDEIGRRRKIALKALHHIKQGSMIKTQAEEIGISADTLAKWLRKYTSYSTRSELPLPQNETK